MRIPYISLLAAGALALGGCAYGDFGYGGGLGYGGYYGNYGYGGYGGYGYGGPYYGLGYGGGYYGGYGYDPVRLVWRLLLSGGRHLRLRQPPQPPRLERQSAALLDQSPIAVAQSLRPNWTNENWSRYDRRGNGRHRTR